MQPSNSIGKAIAYMEQRLKEPIAVHTIAKVCGVSQSTLQRRFLEATHVTLALFLRRLRLNAAASELVTTRRRIVDIALDYQFDSQQTFARAFKQATWLTPGEARRLKRIPDLRKLNLRGSEPRSGSTLLRMRGVMIFTDDVAALTHFYHHVIGFPILDADPDFTQLDAGGQVLVLHAGGRRIGLARTRVEITFFAEDVEATRKELIKRGVRVDRVAIFGELRLCKAADPDGNVFGISNRPLVRPRVGRLSKSTSR
jgi:AraC-like DNA-binding protein/catechol 2,3-dioxygenase-like lactoylglutathione lyase family enzyme